MQSKPLGRLATCFTGLSSKTLNDETINTLVRAFFESAIVVIRDSDLDLLSFAKICAQHGHLCNRSFDPTNYTGSNEDIPVQHVTGRMKDGKPVGIFGQGKLDWHSNFNGPDRATGVGLFAIENVEGSVTSWMNSLPAYEDLDPEIKNRLDVAVGRFHYNPDKWAPGIHEGQREYMVGRRNTDGPYELPLVQKNLLGKVGVYLHKHNDFTIPKDPELEDVLLEHFFKEEYLYHHEWKPGDIILSDQILTMHKRQSDEVSRRLLYRYTFKFDAAEKALS